MKVVQINSTCSNGSTGKICVAVSSLLSSHNIENYILYSVGKSDYRLGIKYNDAKGVKLNAAKAKILGGYGFTSGLATKKLIAELDRIEPDIVHVHNIHTHDCNFEMLFGYLRARKIKLFYTFHDCWAFTGYCTHFALAHCDRWQDECGSCPQYRNYSWFFDRSMELHGRKKSALDGLDLTIITPSDWIAELVKQSFLADYPVKVINNGIDLTVFKPTYGGIREKYGIAENEKLVLGVSSGWSERKGLGVFIELARQLGNEYRIIVVGTDRKTDKKLPERIISIHKTQNQAELAAIYSAADVFVNPTFEDTYPTVNMESLACGTPVITFRACGSPEILRPSCGSVVECGDTAALAQEIVRVCTERPYSTEDCVERAKAFDQNARYAEYLSLYLN